MGRKPNPVRHGEGLVTVTVRLHPKEVDNLDLVCQHESRTRRSQIAHWATTAAREVAIAAAKMDSQLRAAKAANLLEE